MVKSSHLAKIHFANTPQAKWEESNAVTTERVI
jgi:hypothetical protein